MGDQEFNIKFVKEVEKYEELYNYKLPGYSRKDVTEKAWQEVAAQVNMSAAESKEKWRNLRTVFMRKMKPPPSGSGAKKKAYYLETAMQFCLPFIKTSAPPSSGNLPPLPLNSISGKEDVENAEISGDITSQVDSSLPLQFSLTLPTQPTSSPSLSQFEHSASELSQQTSEPQIQFSSSTRPKKNLTLRNKSAADADQCVAEYFKAKKARLEANVADTSPPEIDRQQGLKMFLLSLLPELAQFNDSQIKLFKRRAFCLIDEISNSSQHQPQVSTFHSMVSPQSDNSQTAEYYSSFTQDLRMGDNI